MKSEYIIPTKENPVFKCHNDYFGYIEHNFYKNYEIKNEKSWTIGNTFATNLTDAIIRLHDYIKENPETHIKSKFIIEMVDGTADKYGDPVHTPVYKISMKQAKRFRLID